MKTNLSVDDRLVMFIMSCKAYLFINMIEW